jgi:hypothetical protein
MPRDPQFLTDATKRTFRVKDDANVKQVAAGWDKSPSYIYAIADAEKNDPFCSFVAMYEGLCRGGVSTEHYDRELAFVRHKHTEDHDGHECPSAVISEKFRGYSHFFERFMAYMANDGKLDLEETNDLLDIHAILAPLMKATGKSLLAHKAKLEKSAESGVGSRESGKGRRSRGSV